MDFLPKIETIMVHTLDYNNGKVNGLTLDVRKSTLKNKTWSSVSNSIKFFGNKKNIMSIKNFV